jgi:Tfp pilus assembly protein PilN
MDWVAFAATVGGSAVALAGVTVTAWGIAQQRKSARELAAEQHAHERRLASGARLFEERAAVYDLSSWSPVARSRPRRARRSPKTC